MRPRTRLLLVLLLAVLVYTPGLSGGFAFDDYANILKNPSVMISELSIDRLAQAAWSGNAGMLKRPLASMTFAINYALTGPFPMAFKITNLAIHLINGLFVYWLIFLLLTNGRLTASHLSTDQASQIALLTSLLWLIHPLNVTSVLYVVQRMNSLSAMFTLAALITYCDGRRRQITGAKHGNLIVYAATPVLGIFGLLCKENAVLLVCYCAAIECTAFKFAAASERNRRFLKLACLAILILPVVTIVGSLVVNPEWLSTRYAFRHFTLIERVLTETRILWWYLRMIVLPHLGELGLYHDDFTISSGLRQPWSTLPSMFGLACLLGTGLLLRRAVPVLSLAVLWFLAGHLLESSILSLELMHEHRNYLPSVGILFGVVYGIATMSRRISRARPGYLMVPLVVLFAAITLMRASDWSDPITLATIEATRHPYSHRAVYDLGRIQYGLYQLTGEDEYLDESMANLERSAELDERSKAPYFGLLRLGYVENIAIDPDWSSRLIHRLRYTVVHPSEILEFHNLSQCFARLDCPYPVELVFQLFDAVLANPRLDDRRRAEALINFAAFNVNTAGDIDTAVTILKDAIALRPDNRSYRKMLAQLRLTQDRKTAGLSLPEGLDGYSTGRSKILTIDNHPLDVAQPDTLSLMDDYVSDLQQTDTASGMK